MHAGASDIGDRHPANIHLDTASDKCVYIAVYCIFGCVRKLREPDCNGLKGSRATYQAVVLVLRHHRTIFRSHFAMFVPKDITMMAQAQPFCELLTSVWSARQLLRTPTQPSTSKDIALDADTQVKPLMGDAILIDNLMRMYWVWCAAF
ncbi:hypothetical protein ACHHYP_20549 [Achlya hypogyna]|uniref:Uncharacterized protein n=1 Tax=Achlya hypogyna TaxID=1202772 RepID=A0A1V9YJ79_ACHHY|nr:hypothetical protein ACHHYP_20549 [Achlya hypogyna]